MKINCIEKRIIALLLIIFILTPVNDVLAGTYSDIGEDYWAYNHIMRLSDADIITGYTDNTYKPNRPVSYLETLKLIYGLIEPNEEVINHGLKHYSKLIEQYNISPWAKNAVAVALEKEIITESNLEEANKLGLITDNPKEDQFPSRQTVAIYYARALELKPLENKSLLEYKDIDDIGIDYDGTIGEVDIKGYLAALVDKNILASTGSDGYFEASRPIKRSEMAKITDLAYDYKNKLNIDETLEGNILLKTSMNKHNYIVLSLESGANREITINDNTEIFINNKKVDFTDLKEGQSVSVDVIKDSEVMTGERAIRVVVQAKDIQGTGSIYWLEDNNVTLNYMEGHIPLVSKSSLRAEEYKDFNINENTNIFTFDKKLTIEDLKLKDKLRFKSKEGTLTDILIIPEESHLLGKIVNINHKNKSVSLQLDSGEIYTFYYNKEISDPNIENFSNYKIGEMVYLDLNYESIVSINKYTVSPVQQGFVRDYNINYGDDTITIKFESLDGHMFNLPLSKTINVKNYGGLNIYAPDNVRFILTQLAHDNSMIEVNINENYITSITVLSKDVVNFNEEILIDSISPINPFDTMNSKEWIYNATVKTNVNLDKNTKIKFVSDKLYKKGNRLKISGYLFDNKIFLTVEEHPVRNVSIIK